MNGTSISFIKLSYSLIGLADRREAGEIILPQEFSQVAQDLPGSLGALCRGYSDRTHFPVVELLGLVVRNALRQSEACFLSLTGDAILKGIYLIAEGHTHELNDGVMQAIVQGCEALSIQEIERIENESLSTLLAKIPLEGRRGILEQIKKHPSAHTPLGQRIIRIMEEHVNFSSSK